MGFVRQTGHKTGSIKNSLLCCFPLMYSQKQKCEITPASFLTSASIVVLSDNLKNTKSKSSPFAE